MVRSKVASIQIDPTFPIDEKRIRKLKNEKIRQSPRLLGLWDLHLTCSAFSKIRFPPLVMLKEQVANWWQAADDQLTYDSVRQLIDDSNKKQDSIIQKMIEQLYQAHQLQYAISLGKFLMLKQDIEKEIHADKVLDDRRERVEILVDSICQEVCNEISTLAMLDSNLAVVLTSSEPEKLQKLTQQTIESHTRILHAYTTLADTATQLGRLLQGSSRMQAEQETAILDQLLENLNRENDVARVVNERIKNELPEIK